MFIALSARHYIMGSRLIAIVGPTASGKTVRAAHLAKKVGGEIVSADSRQVYRGMDLGTGKDIAELEGVPYHLIDIRPAGYGYSLFEYLEDSRKAITDIRARGRMPIVCGGTGMYVESVLRGVEMPPVPVNQELRDSLAGKSLEELSDILATYRTLHNVSDTSDKPSAIRSIEIEVYYRANPQLGAMRHPKPVSDCIVIGVDIDRESRRKRISERLRVRLRQGMVDEVCSLLDSGVSAETLIRYGLEYKYVTLYVTGSLSLEEMTTSLEIAIHQFAKRQMTWFRGMERRGIHINWLDWRISPDEFTNAVLELAGVNLEIVGHA